jgi:hypothetical protein
MYSCLPRLVDNLMESELTKYLPSYMMRRMVWGNVPLCDVAIAWVGQNAYNSGFWLASLKA